MKGIKKRELLSLDMPQYKDGSLPGVDKFGDKIDYYIGAHTAGVKGHELLVLRIYQSNGAVRSLRYSVFIDFDNDDFIDYDHKDNKWREAVIENLLSVRTWFYSRIVYLDDYSRRLAGMMRNEPWRETLDVVSDWQSNIRDRSLLARTMRERRKIKAIMDQAAPLPDDIYKYIDDVIMHEHRYSWYKRVGKRINCYCTYCRRDYSLPAPRGTLVGKRGICPMCGSEVQYKAVGAAADIFDQEKFSFACRVSDGILITEYCVSRRMSRDPDSRDYFRNANYENPYFCTRVYISFNGDSRGYSYEARNRKFEKDSGYHWYESKDVAIECPLYPDNLADIIKDTCWQYSALDIYARHIKDCNAVTYLYRVYWNPVLEKMVRIGLTRLVADMVNGNLSVLRDKYNLREALELNIDEIHMLAAVDANITLYALYKEYRAAGKRMKPDELQRAKELRIGRLFYESEELINSTTPGKALKYIGEQLALDAVKQRPRYGDANNFIIDWRDYLRDCGVLGLDFRRDKRILYPRDLGEAHVGTTLRVAAVKTAKYDNAFMRMLPQLEELFMWSDEKYLVRPARCGAELVAEGEALHHCVGRYVERMARGETVILFVRMITAPDTPFVTAEVHWDGTVVQIRAEHNRVPDESVLKFWEKYKREVLEKIKSEGTNESARKGSVYEQRFRAGA